MSTTPHRPHTGRRRNEAARQAILAATRRLLSNDGQAVTVAAIAKEAGIGKQTIYRWWPSKGAVILEALTVGARDLAQTPDTGALESDLAAFLGDVFRYGTEPDNAAILRTLATEAARDPQVADLLRAFTGTRRTDLLAVFERARARGEITADADLELLVDQAFGVYWFRFLTGHAPLTPAAATTLARMLTRAAGA